MQNIQLGTLLQDGKYRIIQVVGQGGFGITYLAEQTMLMRRVAIKEYFPDQYCDRDPGSSQIYAKSQSSALEMDRFCEKFIKEAVTLSRLSHPNVVSIIDVFKENGTAYFVMDYVEGPTLRQMIKIGPMPMMQASKYIRKVADALRHVHSRKINHLDVKPANVIVRTSNDEPVLIDFGLAKNYDIAGHQTSITPTGVSRGYAPLEQYTGAIDTFSPESDIYSLSASFYKLITTMTPPEPSAIINSGGLQFPPNIPQPICDLIRKGMAISRADRYHSIDEFLTDFDAATSGIVANQPLMATHTIPTPPPASTSTPISAPVQPSMSTSQPIAPQPIAQPTPQPIAPAAPLSAEPMTDTVISTPAIPTPAIPTPDAAGNETAEKPRLKKRRPRPEGDATASDDQQPRLKKRRPRPEGDAMQTEGQEPRLKKRRPRPIAEDGADGALSPRPKKLRPRPIAPDNNDTQLTQPGVPPAVMPPVQQTIPQTFEQTPTSEPIAKPASVPIPEPMPTPEPTSTPISDPTVVASPKADTIVDQTIIASETKSTPPTTTLSEDNTETSTDNDKDDLKSKKNIALIAIIIAAIAIGAGIAYLLFSNSDEPATKVDPVVLLDDEAESYPETPEPQAFDAVDMDCIVSGLPAKYTGPCTPDSLPNGSGVVNFNSSAFSTYEGDIVNGKITGKGTLTSRNGNVFVGTFDDGSLIEGKLTIKESGNYYEGRFSDNNPSDGKWFNKNGQLIRTI